MPLIRILIIFILFNLPAVSYGQYKNISTPIVQSFPKELYGGGTQNWGFAQDQRGIIYAANNEGLLVFDSETWRIYPLPNHTIIRSIVIGPHGAIYVGGQDEIGYFGPSANGELVYHSLKGLIEEKYEHFEDVWNTVIEGSAVFFRASDRIYIFDQDQIRVFAEPGTLSYLGRDSKGVLIHHSTAGLLRYKGNTFVPVSDKAPFVPQGGITTAVELGDDSLLIATSRSSLYLFTHGQTYPWYPEHYEYLNRSYIQTVMLMPNGMLAFGTAFGGLLITKKNGVSEYLVTKNQGLQTNHIRAVFADRDENLWLGLDNGIDYVLTQSPFKRVLPDPELAGTAYAALITHDSVYLGTSTGLYVTPWLKHYNPFQTGEHFKLIPGTQGQVWGIDTAAGDLFMAHHEGAFEIIGDNAIQITDVTGFWKFLPLPTLPATIIGGSYQGIYLFKTALNGRWQRGEKFSRIAESARIMTMSEDGTVWFSHPYRGIYRIPVSTTPVSAAIFYGHEKGLPSDQNNFITTVYNQITACTEKGIYHFNAPLDRFEIDSILTAALGDNQQVRYMREDNVGNIWYVLNDEVGVLLVTNIGLQKSIQRHPLPEMKDKLVGGFELIYPADENNVFFGTDEGFVHYEPSLYNNNTRPLRTIISQVYTIVQSDSLVYGGFSDSDDEQSMITPQFPNTISAFRFHFAATTFEQLAQTEYQYTLEGLDNVWLDWTTSTLREYTNLPPGTYTFKVRSRISQDHMGDVASYAFTILPPWYKTKLAYLIYTLLIVALLLSIVMIPRHRYRREKEQLRQEHQAKEASHIKAVQQSEEEIMRLKNDKLEADVRHKNNELASSTMHLVQKNALIKEISDELQKIRSRSSNAEIKKELTRLVRLVDRDNKADEEWDQFAFYFDQVHQDFFKRLKEQFPELTLKDHKLCAYLRLNLSSKDIAPLLNISVRGVELSRYRLRKKLRLKNSENLNEYLMKFGEGQE